MTLPAAFFSVITSLPPLSATDLTLPPETPRPLISVVVVHFFLPFYVVHVFLVLIAERANDSPVGSPTASEAMFAPPLPWVTLNLRLGCPVARPLLEPEAVGAFGQLTNLIAADELVAARPDR